jgi:predicted dehydrogenase
MIRFGVVGTGWRTDFFLRIAAARPDLFEIVGVVTRDVERAKQTHPDNAVNFITSIDDLLSYQPDFVVTSVPWDVNPGVVTELAQRGVPVLSETPPATSIAEMEALYRLVQGGAMIAVAEQYHLQPHHAARLAFIDSGKLGVVTQAQVSVAHGYHGISLIRRMLGITYENAIISTKRFISPVVMGPGRDGLSEEETITQSEQLIATLDFGDKLAVFDFTPDQYHSYIRGPRILIRGERGELVNDCATYLQDFRTPITVDFQRHEAGQHGNMEGKYLKGIQAGASWLYKNPVAPARLFDDEIAVADCLLKMADYVDGTEPFYSLAEACQDRYLDIMIYESLEHGQPVTTTTQVWAN